MSRFVLLAVVLVLVGGCGVRPGGVVLGGPAPTTASAAVLYLVADGRVVPVPRPDPGPSDGLTLLTAGPTAAERDQGFTTDVPVGVVLGGSSSADGFAVTASVDVSALSPTAVDQIVCTAALDSSPVTVTGGGRSTGPRTCPVR